MENTLPRLNIHMGIVERNILRMAAKAKSANLEFRPHFKTHQSIAIGEIFRKFGVSGITVSSLKMASYFIQDGWNDITVAFPAPIHEINTINTLAERIHLHVLSGSFHSAKLLDQGLKVKTGVYIEIDTGQARSGIPITQLDEISRIFRVIQQSRMMTFSGFYCHAGQSYAMRKPEEVKMLGEKVLGQLKSLKQYFPKAKICYGDTPTCSILETFEGIDQISPGNFVFYDWMQHEIGSCTQDDIAVMMECPIVDKNEQRNQLIIHGGAIHFSKDHLAEMGIRSFGQLAHEWGKPLIGNYLSSISQEHGIVQCDPIYIRSKKIGDTVQIYPIHSCLTANLMGEYADFENDEVLDHLSGSSEEKRPDDDRAFEL